jgi:hypothetical protein
VVKDATTYYPATINAVQGEWNHVAGVYDGSALKSYRNGVLQTTNTGPSGASAVATGQLRLGSGNSYRWDGGIKHVFIFNKALDAEQIASLSADPYQILKPVPISYFTAAAAAGFEPQWAVNNNTVIQQVLR